VTNDPRPAIEAILFVAEEPVPASTLAEVLEVSRADVLELLATMCADLDDRGSGLCLREVAGGWRLATRPEQHPWVERFAVTPTAQRLSAAALEALAVVAYRQPVSRAQVAELRGVDSDSALRTLERRALVVEVGRLPLPGNPALYATTGRFLELLDLPSLDALPPLADHIPPAGFVETLEETFRTDDAD
jgi:segregation and condensation protein B